VNLYSSDNKRISLYTKGIASTEEAEIILNFYFDNHTQTLTANISATENYLPMSCWWGHQQQQLESAKTGVPLISETGVPFIAKIGVPTDFSEQYDIEAIRNEILSDISQCIEYSFAVSKELETVEEKVVECLRFWQVAQLNVEHIWESGTMHQATWYSQNDNYQRFPIYAHFGSPTAGAFDATISEMVGIPLLIRTSYQLMSDKEQREAFSQIFTKQGFISLKNSVKNEVVESIEYPEKGVYYTTNTAVVVALAVVVGGSNLLVKGGKKLFELFEILETLGQKFKGCTNIIQYINKLKAQNLKTSIIQFQELFEKISPEKLENIIRLVPDNEVDEVMANLHKLKDTPDFEHLISNTPEEVISVIKKSDVNSENLSIFAKETGNLVGKYTTKIKWGTREIDVRPFGDKGYWGKRVSQTNSRVDAFELKINPNNESFYVWNPNKKRFVQFENISPNSLQDGKCVLQANKSIYRVYDRPELF